MSIYRPLFWTQGLFLEPQHFQLMDRHQDALLDPLRRYLTPYFWGVVSLEIQKSVLGSGVLRVTAGEFVFPDGSHVLLPGNGVIEGRSFVDEWADQDRPLPIYLGIRRHSEHGRNVTVAPQLEFLTGVTSRFVTLTEPEEVLDQHLEGPTGQAQYLNYNLRIVWPSEKDQLGDYALLQIGQLIKSGGEICLDESCLPPSICIRATLSLFNTVKEIRDELAARSRRLEDYKRQRGINTAEFGARDMVYLLALRTLNRYVPLFFHLTEAPFVHPWLVYSALRQLVGELSTFSDDINVHGESVNDEVMLPVYDHQNLGLCFLAAQSLVVRLLDEVTAGPEYIISLHFDGSYYYSELSPAIFEGNNRFYLVVQTSQDPQATIDALTGIAKTGTRESIPLLIARSLPGLKLEYLQLPPQELPRRPGSLYFQIDHHGSSWGNIQQVKNIALYWDSAPEDFKVDLMVVERA